MDNLTHSLAGAALGEAGLKRLSGLGMAALIIGANLPDLDVVAIPFGENLTFRRGWTHGPIAMLVLPVLLTLALVGWDRWQARRGRRPASRLPVRPRQLLLLSYVGVLSHPALDWLNTYGVRLLMPFSERWFYGDSIFIIDPWIWLALGLGVLVSRWRSRKRGRSAPRASRVALGATAAYIALMVLGSRSAHDHAVAHLVATENRTPERVMAGPVPLNPLRRQLIYDLGDAYRFGDLAWRPAPVVTLEPGETRVQFDHPAVQAALPHPDVQRFLYWSRFPFFAVVEEGDSVRVDLGDARFGRDAADWFTVSVRVPAPASGVVTGGP